MHPYVCLAILGACKEELMETEQPELQARLQRLPALDIDMIITQATHMMPVHSLRVGAAPTDLTPSPSSGVQYPRNLQRPGVSSARRCPGVGGRGRAASGRG